MKDRILPSWVDLAMLVVAIVLLVALTSFIGYNLWLCPNCHFGSPSSALMVLAVNLAMLKFFGWLGKQPAVRCFFNGHDWVWFYSELTFPTVCKRCGHKPTDKEVIKHSVDHGEEA